MNKKYEKIAVMLNDACDWFVLNEDKIIDISFCEYVNKYRVTFKFVGELHESLKGTEYEAISKKDFICGIPMELTEKVRLILSE